MQIDRNNIDKYMMRLQKIADIIEKYKNSDTVPEIKKILDLQDEANDLASNIETFLNSVMVQGYECNSCE